jgi:hypothetical protein
VVRRTGSQNISHDLKLSVSGVIEPNGLEIRSSPRLRKNVSAFNRRVMTGVTAAIGQL